MGLFAAIPAVIGYNRFSNQVDRNVVDQFNRAESRREHETQFSVLYLLVVHHRAEDLVGLELHFAGVEPVFAGQAAQFRVGRVEAGAEGVIERRFPHPGLRPQIEPELVVLGMGLVNYNASDILKIMGCKTSQIKKRLGFRSYDEVIHRDNLMITAYPDDARL